MKEAVQQDIDFELLLAPENPLEKQLLQLPNVIEGLHWGQPRYGHPEGKVGLHIREVLDNIDQLIITEQERELLRLAAFVHDTFKYVESKTIPRHRDYHHGVLARQFLEEIDPRHQILDIIELHDEAYFAWRDIHLYRQKSRGQKRFETLLQRMDTQLQLYYSFFKCDTQTGDKTQAPLIWFEQEVTDIDLIQF